MAFFQKNKKFIPNKNIVIKEKGVVYDENLKTDFSDITFKNENTEKDGIVGIDGAVRENQEKPVDKQNENGSVKRNLIDSIDEIQPQNAVLKPLYIHNNIDDIYDLSCIDKTYGKDINVFPEGVSDTASLISFLQNELNKEKPQQEIDENVVEEKKEENEKEIVGENNEHKTENKSEKREKDIFDLIDDDFDDF